jgi:hydrogenase maturation protease
LSISDLRFALDGPRQHDIGLYARAYALTTVVQRAAKLKTENRKSEILIIGLGNEYRADDAVGLLVARRVRELGLENVKAIEESGEGAHLIEAWKGAETVIIVDAVSSGSNPGSVHRFDAIAKKVPSKFFHHSSHAFSVVEAIELARAMSQLPSRLIVIGVEGHSFEAGVELSSEVKQAVEEVVDWIKQGAFR